MIQALFVVAVAACGGDQQMSTMSDSRTDDGPLADATGDCVTLSAELVDWDSSTSAFQGVSGAKLSAAGNPTVILVTPPNGRIDACVPAADPIRLDVDAPGDYLDGSMVVPRSALTGLYPISFRGITTARADTFFTERGLTYDPSKAQVLVFAAGDRAPVSLDRAHDPAQAGNDDAQAGTFVWSVSDSGRYILFPNVDVTQATGTITGDRLGPVVIPLAAGKLTVIAVTVIFV